MPPFPTQRLFGLDFVTDMRIDEVASTLAALGDDLDEWRCVITPNVDHLVRYERHPAEAAVAQAATVVLPDGMPIVWAGRLLGRPLGGRLTGSDLFASLWPRLAERKAPAVVIASSPAVAEKLRATHGTVRCVVPPMFDVTDERAVSALVDEIDAHVDAVSARFVIVGVSMPKHHLIAGRLRARWVGRSHQPVVMLLGASADLALGLVPRAPGWMQRWGMEWAFRLALEPRRLAKRYLVDDVVFVRLTWAEWRRQRRGQAP